MGGFLVVSLSRINSAVAFPFIDPTNTDSVPTGAPLGTELPATDVQGLGNQLRLVNPAAPGNRSAWTIVPRMTMQQLFTDNALEEPSPRRFDAITVFAPGISIVADTARLQLRLDYQPNLIMHAIEGPLNVMTQQLNATGIITVVPDFAYIDVRALSGVQSQLGALAGTGTLGQAGTALAPATGNTAATLVQGTGQEGLNRNNEVQTTSFGISPYLLRQFGDYGMGKIGVSANASRYSTISGFVADPLPTGGGGENGQNLLTTEEIAHYTTGQFMEKFQYSVDIDVSQSVSQTGASTTNATTATGATTTTAVPSSFTRSQRQTFNNQLSYALNHSITLLATAGEQRINYTGQNTTSINGLTWSAGFTYTPGPYSSITITYGRTNGVNALQASGHLAVGGRSFLTMSYSNSVGTQLENLQNQLNNSVINVNGQLVNAITGGPNFVAQNGLGLATGVFRYNTLNTSFTTQWLRDTFSATAAWSVQTSIAPGGAQTTEFIDPSTGNVVIFNQPISSTGQSTDIKTVSLSWTHELRENLSLGSSASYSMIRAPGGVGNQSSISAAIGLQYMTSASTALSARYSFFDRISTIPGYSLYENVLLLGLTKQF